MLRSTFLLILLTVFSLSLFNNCSQDSQSKSIEEEEEEVTAIPVEAHKVVVEDVSAYYTGTATLEAEEEAHAITNVRGIIKEIHLEEGDRVSEGQVLARLEEEQVGGLIFSTVITLVILPTIYVLLDDMKRWSKEVIRTAKR